MRLAEVGSLTAGSTVVLTAIEYNVAMMAMVVRITRSPEVTTHDQVTTVH